MTTVLSGIAGNAQAPTTGAVPPWMTPSDHAPLMNDAVNAHTVAMLPALGTTLPVSAAIAVAVGHTLTTLLTATANDAPLCTAATLVARAADVRHWLPRISKNARSNSRDVRTSVTCCMCRRNLYHMIFLQ